MVLRDPINGFPMSTFFACVFAYYSLLIAALTYALLQSMGFSSKLLWLLKHSRSNLMPVRRPSLQEAFLPSALLDVSSGGTSLPLSVKEGEGQ